MVSPPLALAPMEDVTNQAFRVIAKRIGNPGLMVTEFVSAMAIQYNAAKTLKKMNILEAERPLAIQIFGSDIGAMVQAAQLSEEMGADIVDINMGCWVPKVVRQGSGAALLKEPDQAEAIVKAVVKAVCVPVTVKVRAGWDERSFCAPDLGKRFEQAGAQAITIHARYAKQGLDGRADWDLISQMRNAVSMPVIGNGDIKEPEDAVRMLSETGCHGVMVGRAAISNPWALARISAAMQGKPIPELPKIEERITVALEHLKRLVQFEIEAGNSPEDAEIRSVRHLRGQIPLYIKGEHGAARVRDAITKLSTVREVESVLMEFQDQCIKGQE